MRKTGIQSDARHQRANAVGTENTNVQGTCLLVHQIDDFASACLIDHATQSGGQADYGVGSLAPQFLDQ